MNRLAPLPIALLLTAALSGCVTFKTTDDGVARARIGESVQAGMIAVTPVAVLEDSRCARGVQCVWAGRVRLSVRINGGAPMEVATNQPLTLAGGRTLSLIEVYPEKRADEPIYPDQYRFGFRVQQ